MRVNMLGAVEIVTDEGRTLALNGSKVGQVLALLALRCGDTVSVDTLIEELWGEKPPRSALATLQTYIYHLRRWFTREGLLAGHGELLVTRSPGYQFQAVDGQVDAKEFERLVTEAGDLLYTGQPEAAIAGVRDGLGLWRGPAFANIQPGPVLQAHVTHLAELRLRAMHVRIEAERSLGRHRECIPELRALVMNHPLNETFHAYLIEALYRSGRRAEALRAYQELWAVLDRELGVEPSPEVQELQREVLEFGRNGERPGRIPVAAGAAGSPRACRPRFPVGSGASASRY